MFASYVARKHLDPDADPVEGLRAGWELHVGFGLARRDDTLADTAWTSVCATILTDASTAAITGPAAVTEPMIRCITHPEVLSEGSYPGSVRPDRSEIPQP